MISAFSVLIFCSFFKIMLCNIPSSIIVIMVTVPPALISGNGIPVAGIPPVLVPTLIKTSKSILMPIPTDNKDNIGSALLFMAAKKQMTIIMA